MFDELVGAYGSRFLIAAGGVGIALLLLVAVLLIMRSRGPSPFVRGGRNRQPRLQVLDAAAVDARRRLVLVRRDDVEHLVMIGGPTDIVIESRILPFGEPEQESARGPTKGQPVMIADAEPVARPSPEPALERSLAAIEEDVPEPASINVEQVPPPRQPEAPSMPEPERGPRHVSAPAVAIEPRPQQQTFSPPEPVRIEASAAADILESARQRVLNPQRVEPQLINPPPRHPASVQPSMPVRGNPAGLPPAPPAAQPSDFQRVLEEEMTSTLAAERVAATQNTPIRPASGQPGNLPRRDPEMAPITGADAALQNEVARIFGEMSVNRDK
jgi:hypothetical protein